MDSDIRISSAYIPATLALAGKLLVPGTSDAAEISVLSAAYADEYLIEGNDLAHEFAPYLYKLLNEQGIAETLPKKLVGEMRDGAIAAASIAVARRHIIKQVGDRLAEANIEAILLKGAAMDQWIYPDQAFRLGADIDLLVHEKDYALIDTALASVASAVEKYPGRDAFNSFAVEKSFLVEKPRRVYLDVHRNLTIPHVYALNPSTLFERATPHPAHPNLRVMSPEDNLLHFAVHSFYDMRLFNKQTLDAACLITRCKINWQTLQTCANEYRMRLPLEYFLSGVGEIYPLASANAPEQLGELSSPRAWAVKKLLTAHPADLGRRNLKYRCRQLACQFFLSGNIKGYIQYNLAYARAQLQR